MTYDCFISYASADVALADALNRALTAAGLSVWFDRTRLRAGFDWHREIEAACENSRVVLPLLTPRWQLSEWTKYETYGAEAVIPLVAEGPFEDVATPPLRRAQAAALSVTGGIVDAANVVRAVHRHLADSPPDPDARTRLLVHIRYRPTEHFVGRERDLEGLHEQLHAPPTAALTQGGACVISALGGVGKTTLARMYAEKFWRAYERVLWVDARLGLESEFAQVLELLRPDIGADMSTQPTTERAARALHYLQGLSSCRPLRTAALLIIDNAADEQAVAPWIPRTGDVHTLITSRFAHWEAIPVRRIDVLEPGSAQDLLLRRAAVRHASANLGEVEACQTLASRLGFLPLALEQAAAFIRSQGEGFGFTDYIRLYDASTRALLSMPVRGTTEYPEPVLLTWLATISMLSKGARAMFRIAAFLAPTEIPLALFEHNADQISRLALTFTDAPEDQVDEAAPGELRARAWRKALADYSMAHTSSASGMLVHGLVQTVERSQIEPHEQRQWLLEAIAALGSCATACAHSPAHQHLWRYLLPHAQTLIRHASACNVVPPSWLLDGTSRVLAVQGRWSEAIDVARLLLAQNERALGPDHVDTLANISNLAFYLERNCAYSEAEPLSRAALTLSERLNGTEHPTTLTAAGNLATLLDSRGDYAEAEHLFRRALDGREQVLGPGHPETTLSLNNLACFLQRRASPEAGPLLRRALEAAERVYGPDHPDTLILSNNIAGVLLNQGAYAEAEPLFRRVVDHFGRFWGPEHPQTLTAANNLAYLLQAKGELSEATRLYRHALEGTERALGPNHQATLLCLNNLGRLLQARGEAAEAEPLLRRALAGRERLLGSDHVDTLTSVIDLAALVDGQGDGEQAGDLYRRAHTTSERVLGSDHPLTITSVQRLAQWLIIHGSPAEGEPLLRRALETSERVLGSDHPQTLAVTNDLAGVLQLRGAFEEAAHLWRQTVESRARVLGPEHPDTLLSLNNLAGFLEGMGAYAAAEPLYRHASEGLERAFGRDHPSVQIALENWVRCQQKVPVSASHRFSSWLRRLWHR